MASATYAELVKIRWGLTLEGAGSSGASTTTISMGIELSSLINHLTIDKFYIKGDGGSNSVIYVKNGYVKNLKISNCILDGEGNSNPDRKGFYGLYIGETLTITGTTFQNFYHWYLVDNTHSSHDVPLQLKHVVFTNNIVTNSKGSIAFRG